MSVKVKTKRKVKIEMRPILDRIVVEAIGMIQRRTAKGIDMHGRPFAAYAPSTKTRYTLMGENLDVDLTITGAMLADIKALKRVVTKTGARAIIGLGAGTSVQLVPRAGQTRRIKLAEKSGNAKRVERAHASGAKRSARRSPPHNVLARYIHNGTPHMRARPFLGLAPDDRRKLRDLIKKLSPFKQA